MTRTNGNVGRVASSGPQAAEMYTNKGIMKEAVVMQMTWPGAPTIYYGDEAGVCGWTDPDNRRTYPWGREDLELIEFHRDAIHIHKHNRALKKGSFKALLGEYNVIAYGRFLEDNIIAVGINNNDVEKELKIPVWQLGVADGECMESLLVSNRDSYNVGKLEYPVVNGRLVVTLPPFGAGIFRKKSTN